MLILLEFGTNHASEKGQLGRYFYEGFKPSIKLWIVKKNQKLDGWNSLVKKATRAKAKACISDNNYLDLQFPRGNQPSTINNQTTRTRNLWDKPIASIKDRKKASLESQLSYPHILHSNFPQFKPSYFQTNMPQKMN